MFTVEKRFNERRPVDEEYRDNRRKKKNGFNVNVNPSSGSRYNADVGAWKHDLYQHHEQQFADGYSGHSPGNSGGFSSTNSNSHKSSRNTYYSKKLPSDSSKSKPTQNGSSKTARDAEQQEVR